MVISLELKRNGGGTKGIFTVPIMFYFLENQLCNKNKQWLIHMPEHYANVKMNEKDLCADTERSPRYIKLKSSVKVLCTVQSLLCKYDKNVNVDKCWYRQTKFLELPTKRVYSSHL